MTEPCGSIAVVQMLSVFYFLVIKRAAADLTSGINLILGLTIREIIHRWMSNVLIAMGIIHSVLASQFSEKISAYF